ncbi:MAG: FtsB family cell division protein [Thermoleophilia bacterium]
MAAPKDNRSDRSGTPRRRRGPLVLALLVCLILVAGVLVSINPYMTYRQVTSEQHAMESQVALLEQENAAVQAQIDRLKHDSYLETLARSELNLARPGEDVFIVTGAETAGTDEADAPEAPEPGPLEKMLGSLRHLF